MRFFAHIILSLLLLSFSNAAFSKGKRICELIKSIPCPSSFKGSRSSSGSSMPSNSSSMNLNPSTVSIKEGAGVEIIHYRGYHDVNFVTGNGAVGSGLSTTNNDGTFFGNLPKETEEQYKTRKLQNVKHRNQKTTLATAIKILPLGKKKSRRFWTPEFNLGVIGKYNGATKNGYGGGGFSAKLGFLTGAASRNKDDYKISDNAEIVEYYQDALSYGITIGGYSLEFTELYNRNAEEERIKLITTTALFKNFMLTYGNRKEYSQRSRFNYDTENFDISWKKEYSFIGVQYSIAKRILLGVFYNYYLNEELSFGFTAFL